MVCGESGKPEHLEQHFFRNQDHAEPIFNVSKSSKIGAHNHSRERVHQTQAAVALLLAGQTRTFGEKTVRDRLLQTIAIPQRADCYLHLSPEFVEASWHHNTKINWPVQGKDNSMDTPGKIRSAFKSLNIDVSAAYVASDEKMMTHQLWRGFLQGDMRTRSVLALRWLILYQDVQSVERSRKAPYKWLVRSRPDYVLPCTWETSKYLERLPRAFVAAVDGDHFIVMRPSAAASSLTAYSHANKSDACKIKLELCVPALLRAAGFRVAIYASQNGRVVRPQNDCAISALQRHEKGKAALPDHLSCGREVVYSKARACSNSPNGPWNDWPQKILLSRWLGDPGSKQFKENTKKGYNVHAITTSLLHVPHHHASF